MGIRSLINSEEELFEIEQKIKNREDASSQVKFLKKRLKKLFPQRKLVLMILR